MMGCSGCRLMGMGTQTWRTKLGYVGPPPPPHPPLYVPADCVTQGRQRTSIHGGEDYAAGEGGVGGGGSAYTSFPPFGSMSRLRRGMMVQFCREDEGALQGVGSASAAAAAAAWEYPPRKAARLF